MEHYVAIKKEQTIATWHNTESSKALCPVKENCLKRLHIE